MSEIELKPCPFCGSKVVWEELYIGDSAKPLYSARCENRECPNGDYNGDTLDALVLYWNTRPLEDALRAEVETYRETLVDNEAHCVEMANELDEYRARAEQAEAAHKFAQIYWMRALEERDQLKTENKQLRGELGMKDDALSSYAEFYDRAAMICGYPDGSNPSRETDLKILHMLAEHDEIDVQRARAERAEMALRGLADAVHYDLRHADDEDDDKAWTSLEGIKSALEIAKDALEGGEG